MFTGDQEFLDSLHKFPRDVKVGNIYIRGGDRTDLAYPKNCQTRALRPKMSQAALHALLTANKGNIVDGALQAEDKLAGLNLRK